MILGAAIGTSSTAAAPPAPPTSIRRAPQERSKRTHRGHRRFRRFQFGNPLFEKVTPLRQAGKINLLNFTFRWFFFFFCLLFRFWKNSVGKSVRFSDARILFLWCLREYCFKLPRVKISWKFSFPQFGEVGTSRLIILFKWSRCVAIE